MRNRRAAAIARIESAPSAYSGYTFEEVQAAADVFTAIPSPLGNVDVRTLAQRRRDELDAFVARLQREQAAQ